MENLDNLDIINLYEESNKERTKNFTNKTESTLKVNVDSKKTTRDLDWIEIMEETIPYIDNIFRSPNRFIVNEEEVVKIEQAKKITVESIKHLSKNTNFIQTIDKITGDVTPSKLLNVRKEESYDTYENRLIYTLVQNMKLFIKRRKESLELEIKNPQNNEHSSKDDKSIEYNATSNVNDENVNVNISLNSSLDYQGGNSTESAQNILNQIEEVEKKITSLESSEVYKVIDKLHISLVREPIKKTNVVLKNVNFQYAMKLWSYLRDNFDDKTTSEEEKKEYMDNGELKQLMDQTFLLQYLAMKTLDEDKLETQDTKEEISNALLEQMLDKMIDMNTDLTGQELKQMISEHYEVIRYKKMEILQEIQKIFKKNIDKYTKKVEKNLKKERIKSNERK